MLGNWENKCLVFGRTKVRRKSPAAYQEAQIKKQIFAGHSLGPIEPIKKIFFFTSGSPLNERIFALQQ